MRPVTVITLATVLLLAGCANHDYGGSAYYGNSYGYNSPYTVFYDHDGYHGRSSPVPRDIRWRYYKHKHHGSHSKGMRYQRNMTSWNHRAGNRNARKIYGGYRHLRK